MNILSWEEFSAIFAEQSEAQACAVRKAFIEQHPECAQYPTTSPAADYAAALVYHYGYPLDFKEGTTSIVEYLEDVLGASFTAELHDDGETIGVRFDGREIMLIHHPMWDDEGFEQDLRQLEQLMGEQFYFVMRNAGISDTIEMLLVPAGHWIQAEKIYGQALVSVHFNRCTGIASSAATSTSRPSPQATDQHSAKAERHASIRRFCYIVLPVLLLFGSYTVWRLQHDDTLTQSSDCQNVDKPFRNLPPDQAEPLKAQMRQLLGCSTP